MECKADGELLYFECERCGTACIGIRADLDPGGRVFCGSCGACYCIDFVSAGITGLKLYARRIWFSHMYLPPLEWNEIFGQGQDSGRRNEIWRRHLRSIWQRFKDFIHNN
jgi:hypothetical protein